MNFSVYKRETNDLNSFKDFADHKFNALTMISHFDIVEKKLREKDKMMVTSIFSFFPQYFDSLPRWLIDRAVR